MSAARWCAAVLLAAGALVAQDPAVAFVEVEAPAAAFQQEAVRFVVRVGYDAAFFAAQAVPLFQQPLDQPFQVFLPWLLAADDRAVEVLPPAAGGKVQRIAVGDRVVPWTPLGPQRRGGRSFEVLELQCRWVPLVAGEQVAAPVELRYAYAKRFEEDFLRGRQPVDRQEASVLSAPTRLTVKALPAAGRPPGFCGAVGEFRVRATAALDSVPVGQSFALEVEVAGEGNLTRLAAPAWPELEGFHVQGLVERRSEAARTFVFDVLALRAGATSVPTVAFGWFSPRDGAYRTARTDPVPLRVLPQPAGAALPDRVRALVAADAEAVRRAAAWPWWVHGALLAAALGTGLGGWTLRGAAQRRGGWRAALARLEGGLHADPERALQAFEEFCARCAELPSFAPADVRAALAARGVGAATLDRVAALHERLSAARYGGVVPGPDEQREVARAVVSALLGRR